MYKKLKCNAAFSLSSSFDAFACNDRLFCPLFMIACLSKADFCFHDVFGLSTNSLFT